MRLLLILSVALIRAQVSLPAAEATSALDERTRVASAGRVEVLADTTEAQPKDANIGSTVEAAPAVVVAPVTKAVPTAEERDAPTPAAEAEPASKPGAAEEEGGGAGRGDGQRRCTVGRGSG